MASGRQKGDRVFRAIQMKQFNNSPKREESGRSGLERFEQSSRGKHKVLEARRNVACWGKHKGSMEVTGWWA